MPNTPTQQPTDQTPAEESARGSCPDRAQQREKLLASLSRLLELSEGAALKFANDRAIRDAAEAAKSLGYWHPPVVVEWLRKDAEDCTEIPWAYSLRMVGPAAGSGLCDSLVEVPATKVRNAIPPTVRESIRETVEAWQYAVNVESLDDSTATDPASQQATDTPAPAAEGDHANYSVADLREMTGLANNTINKYAKMAEVKTPLRGKRNYSYTRREVRTILRTIAKNSTEKETRNKCNHALQDLSKITK
jgi:hypothetical protein